MVWRPPPGCGRSFLIFNRESHSALVVLAGICAIRSETSAPLGRPALLPEVPAPRPVRERLEPGDPAAGGARDLDRSGAAAPAARDLLGGGRERGAERRRGRVVD